MTDYTVPPGDFLPKREDIQLDPVDIHALLMGHLPITEPMAKWLGTLLDVDDIYALLNSHLPVTEPLADKLAHFTDIPADRWLSMEFHFCATCKRLHINPHRTNAVTMVNPAAPFTHAQALQMANKHNILTVPVPVHGHALYDATREDGGCEILEDMLHAMSFTGGIANNCSWQIIDALGDNRLLIEYTTEIPEESWDD